jgi:hypothetical protein
MPNATYGVSLSAGGLSISKSINRTGDHPNPYEVTLPVGTAGTLSTRTDDDTGVITVASHSLIVGDKVNVFWNGGKRYGMTVSAQTATTITVGTGVGEVGAGDNFPAASTAVVITKQVVINTAIDGDNIEIIGIVAEAVDQNSTAKAHIDFQDSGGARIEAFDLEANIPQVYDIAGGAVNPFTGNPITQSKAANGSSTEVLTLKIISLEDSTP